MLEDCLPSPLDNLMDVAAALQAILGGSGSAAGASIPAGGLDDTEITGRIGWELDPDGTFPPEMTGSLLLSDGAGGPLPPITAQQVADLASGGIDALGSILPGLPDGSRLDVAWSLPPPTVSSGQLYGTFTGGVLGSTEGTAFYDDMLCIVSLDWKDATLAELQPPFPSATFDMNLTAAPDVVTGSLTAQGTSPASIVTSRNGGPDEAWFFDPATYLATPQ